MNLIAALLVQTLMLSEGDTQAIDWAGCAIKVEFLPTDDSDETARRRALLAGRLAVQEHLEPYLVTLPNVQGIFYDHRVGRRLITFASRKMLTSMCVVLRYIF